MSGGRVRREFLLLIVAFGILALPCLADQPHAKAKLHAKAEPAVQPAAPPAPLTPQQMPATPPDVTFTGGQLTINAPNSTLGDILRAVRKQTGATVDMPGNSLERVVGKFGPGSPRDVMTSLLNGSHFNYMLVGSPSNPSGLDRVILTQKTGGEVAQANANPAPNQQTPPAPQEGFVDMSEDAPEGQQQPDQDIFATDDQNQNQPGGEEQQNGFGNPFGQQGNNVKTPEQMLQELQQRQQQIQQQQTGQQQPGGQPPGVPFPRGGLPQAPPPQQPQ